ncbi:MAG: hypothetical protein AB1483_05585 [Candidatus Zixiibacteriota bacterium]
MNPFFRISILLVSLLVILALFGCGATDEDTNNLDPEVLSKVDTFSFWAGELYTVTARLTYSWTNTGTSALIDHSSARLGGSAALILLDNDGIQVYQANLQSGVTDVSAPGNPGSWTVVVAMEDFTGTVSFRVKKQ